MYLFKVGNRLARIHVKERLEHGECSGEGLFNSFCAGFVKGVGSELDKNCKALALVVPQKVKESYDVISKDFRIIKTTIPTVDKVAYNEGIIEGKRALNAQYIESNDFD